MSGVELGVIVGVGLGVGVIVIALTVNEIPPQGFVGVTVGVGVIVGVTLGVGVGVGLTAQLKTALKSILQTDVGDGVGDGQEPAVKKLSHKSGQELTHGDLPNNKQLPSKTVDKHQEFDVIDEKM
jgi:hypothetical protein